MSFRALNLHNHSLEDDSGPLECILSGDLDMGSSVLYVAEITFPRTGASQQAESRSEVRDPAASGPSTCTGHNRGFRCVCDDGWRF